jgi:2-oxoglutarate dehydrogenase E1 component
VPALEQVIKRGGQLGLKEIVIGMPHRGLNVLATVMAKLPGDLQRVQRRLGSSGRGRRLRRREISPAPRRTASSTRTAHLSLTANPSHLGSSIPSCSARCGRSRISFTIAS